MEKEPKYKNGEWIQIIRKERGWIGDYGKAFSDGDVAVIAGAIYDSRNDRYVLQLFKDGILYQNPKHEPKYWIWAREEDIEKTLVSAVAEACYKEERRFRKQSRRKPEIEERFIRKKTHGTAE